MFGSIAVYFNYDTSESDNEENSAQCESDVPIATSSNYQDNHQVLYNNRNEKDMPLHIKNMRDAANVLELPEERFMRTFRINKEVFSKLLEEITPKIKTTYRCTHIPTPIKLARFLAFIATGGQTSMNNEFDTTMSKSQVSKIISEMLDIFQEHLCAKWVQLEQNQDDENETKENFYNSSGIPGVVGCVDNTHIRIKPPDKQVKHLFHNRSDFYSLNVLAICNHDMLITHVDASQPGAYKDAYVWKHSSADSYFKRNYLKGRRNTWVLGGPAYKSLPYMLTPYRYPLETNQKLFNERHSKIRNIIKQCFHDLKTRFSCLTTSTGLKYIPEKAVKIVITCCILHNICITYKNNWQPSDNTLEDIDNVNDDNEVDTVEMFHDECPESNSIRDEIAEGILHWVSPTEISQNRGQSTAAERLDAFYNKDTRLHRKHLRDATNVLELPEDRFIKTFRINKEIFSMLLKEIIQKMRVTYRCTHTPASIKLATFLAFIATGAQKSPDGNKYASKSQVSKMICEMLDLFEEHLYPKWLKFERNEEDENITKDYFYNITGIPGIVGCVNNTHIRIKTPAKEVKHLYKNSKGFSSLNTMMICDHNMVITYVDANQPGSYNNAYVWEQSSANNYLRNNYLNGKINTWVIGDTTYKLLPYLMTPYKNHNDSHQQLFNEKHWEIRHIIKQCINVMKNRFSCLITPTGLQYTPEKAVKIVITCCILHNICITYKNNWQPSDNSLADNVNEGDDDTIETTNEECALSNFTRDEIARNLYCLKTNSFVS